ncbi:hypothetical protein RN001_004529 [Aquatica leii]|uniref:Uncharacterized protein n=1 Tax=Aquatica leii TaxID=1421715 RepID=A0AAN7Q5W1_9COLE|nr:hypothetical protein RN001_004529 [Aquatica leii]
MAKFKLLSEEQKIIIVIPIIIMLGITLRDKIPNTTIRQQTKYKVIKSESIYENVFLSDSLHCHTFLHLHLI